MTRRIAALVLVTLVAAACNGDDEATLTTPPPITSDTMFVTTTTEPVATTTASSVAPTTPTSSTSDAPTTTAPSTTTPTSTSTPATLPDDISPAEFEQIRADVIEAATASYELFDAIRQDPTNEELLGALDESMTDARVESISERFLIPYVLNNLVERTNPERPARYDFRPETFKLEPDGRTATIEACYLSSNLLIELGGNDDGSDKLQDSRFGAVLTETRMVFEDGVWLDDGGFDLNTAVGEETCE